MENPYSDILDIKPSDCTPAQESLKKALIQLLSGNKLQDISIKELCLYSFTARSTFYAYYNNIDEILEDVENDMIFKLAGLNRKLMDNHVKYKGDMGFYSETISLIEDNKPVFYTLLIANPDQRFIDKWKRAMKYHFWERIKPSGRMKNTELILEITASAAVGAYSFWLTHPYEVDVGDAYRILSGVLKTIDEIG